MKFILSIGLSIGLILCIFFKAAANERQSVDVPMPGIHLISEGKEPICELILVETTPEPHLEVIFLDGGLGPDLDTIFSIIGLTKVGKTLKDLFQEKFRRGEMKIEPMSEEMINLSKKQSEFSGARMAYVHELRTLFYKTKDIRWTHGEFAMSFVHELTHAKDLLGTDTPPTKDETLTLEMSAFTTQDLFFEELIKLVPCYKEMFPEFPRRFNRDDIRKDYKDLR